MGNYVRDAYHVHRRQWARDQACNGKFIGVELEVSHRRGYRHLLNILPDPPTELDRPATERDASLPERDGLEIVFPPLSYRKAKDKQSFLALSMGILHLAGTTTADRYGMHMNVNCAGWPVDKASIFCAVLNWADPEYLRRIGGRALNGYCRQYRWLGLREYGHELRCTAGKRGENRIECRFPKATTDHDQFVLVVNFLELVERYAELTTTRRFLSGLLNREYNVRRNVIPTREQSTSVSAAVTEHFTRWLCRLRSADAVRVREVLLDA